MSEFDSVLDDPCYIAYKIFKLYQASFVFPKHTDMSEEMRVETMELCVTACEKFATNNEVFL